MRLLVTRPEPDAERTAALLRARGHEVVVAPVLRIEAVPAGLGAGPWAAVVMTSANAARAVASHGRRSELVALPACTVGRRSAEAAREAGFSDVTSADGDIADLVRLLAGRFAGRESLLYLAGEDRAGDLGGALSAYGLGVETVVIYRAAAAPAFARQLDAAVASGLDGVLHYSPRSAAAFLAGANAAGLRGAALAVVHYCLSREVAAPLVAAGARTVRIAPRPEEAAFVELLSLR